MTHAHQSLGQPLGQPLGQRFGQPLKFDQTVECDVLIIGGGLAGTWAAVRASQGGDLSVTLVDKGRVGRSGQSPFAAGIFTVFDPRTDNADLWMEEMVTRGEYLNDQAWVKQLFDETWHLAEAMHLPALASV